MDYVTTYVHKKPYSRILVGKIDRPLSERIKSDTGIDLFGYNVAITSEFENSHTDIKKETERGQVPITSKEVALFPKIISEYDTVSYEGYNRQKQQVLKFEKEIEGKK